ncbi:MAG: alanine racemase [Thiohalomonadales bacterium]
MSCVKAIIDFDALLHNYSIAKNTAADARLYAVVKSAAYGHGLLKIAQALSIADGLAVARIEEAILLRQNNIRQAILVLAGVFHEVDLRRACALGLELVVHSQAQIDLIIADKNIAAMRGMKLWLKVDTGMHRLGFSPDQLSSVYAMLAAKLPSTTFILMTHLAKADQLGSKRSATQLKRLQKVILPGLAVSVANSAGILAWPETHADIVRPGIMLYGASPIQEKTAAELGLQPVMTLSSELIAIKALRKGDHVGYGGEWICPEKMQVGVVAIGYGDGYPRHAKAGTPVLINGVLAPLVGRVSMDMICIDLRSLASAKVGDKVVLWGQGLAADLIAGYADTIAYELFCGVTQRVEFSYVDRI